MLYLIITVAKYMDSGQQIKVLAPLQMCHSYFLNLTSNSLKWTVNENSCHTMVQVLHQTLPLTGLTLFNITIDFIEHLNIHPTPGDLKYSIHNFICEECRNLFPNI